MKLVSHCMRLSQVSHCSHQCLPRQSSLKGAVLAMDLTYQPNRLMGTYETHLRRCFFIVMFPRLDDVRSCLRVSETLTNCELKGQVAKIAND